MLADSSVNASDWSSESAAPERRRVLGLCRRAIGRLLGQRQRARVGSASGWHLAREIFLSQVLSVEHVRGRVGTAKSPSYPCGRTDYSRKAEPPRGPDAMRRRSSMAGIKWRIPSRRARLGRACRSECGKCLGQRQAQRARNRTRGSILAERVVPPPALIRR